MCECRGRAQSSTNIGTSNGSGTFTVATSCGAATGALRRTAVVPPRWTSAETHRNRGDWLLVPGVRYGVRYGAYTTGPVPCVSDDACKPAQGIAGGTQEPCSGT